MKVLLSSLCLFFLGFAKPVVAQQNWQSQFVQIDKKGGLTYTPDAKGNRIPDFSKVGYKRGLALPSVAVVTTLQPNGQDDQAMIQAAIDALAQQPADKNGFRGAILLKKGVYRIPGTIRIHTSGIILRGEGNETRLIATGKGQRNLVSVVGTGSAKEISGTRQRITDTYVPVGTHSLTLPSTAQLKKGDAIIVWRPGTQQWIDDLQMNRINQRDSTVKQWQPDEYGLAFERTITKIDKNTIYIDNPIVMAMEEKYGGGEIYRYEFAGRIDQVGVENLQCESEFNGDQDEDHGWNAVYFNRVENGWVNNVTARYFGYSCVNLGWQSKYITVNECKYIEPKSIITGGRRYSFNNDGQLNLVMNCFASEGRHDYVTGARVCGPNVFYNCRSEKAKADIGPHHRWAAGTLFDNIITDGEINIQDRGDWGTGHGWAGVNQVVWNCVAARAAIQNPWVSGSNYVIGLKGKKYSGRLSGRPDAQWEGQNQQGLFPASLYQAQVNDNRSTR